MRIIVGNFLLSTIQGDSVTVTKSMSDPVPTCSISLKDNTSSWTPQALQEVLILDDQMIPNPTVNGALNPTLNPYTTSWTVEPTGPGLTYSQPGGGGITATVSNFNGSQSILQQPIPCVAGQTYCFSVTLSGSSPVNLKGGIGIFFANAAQNSIGTTTTGPQTTPTGSRLSVSATAPSNAVYAVPFLMVYATSLTNSGSITYTQAQLEPTWISTLSYPTPFCGPGQTNCVQLPLGQYIRQYRKFAGFLTHAVATDYHGNSRTWQINAVGYAWLMSTIIVNNSYSSQADSAIISNLLSTYVKSSGTAMCTTTNVVTGVTLTSLQSNWDDLRTLFDNLAAQSTYYWTIDYYWNFIYAPPGYYSMPISLICDNSSTPNMTTTYPAYNFSAEMDYTQPGSTILVIGNGSNVAEVIDPSTTAQNGVVSGYTLPTGTSWMRKVNESGLNSATDCTNRGIAELLQYDYPRYLYHLTTNVELIAGNSIQITSSTDGLTQSTQLIQSVTATWIGTSELLVDTWEYKADLGATNRAVTNIISRLYRLANSNTSAPAISTTTLALIEKIGLVDTVATGSTATGYAATILADTPLAYYRLIEQQGTTADDFSGNGYAGTLHGTVQLNTVNLLHSGSFTSMTFDGSSGYISLPTTFVPTGAHAWSIECWCQLVALPTSGTYGALVAMGANSNQQQGALKVHNVGGTGTFILSTWNGDIVSGTISTGTTYYLAGTYDGTSTRLYLNGSLVAGPTNFTLNITATYASIAADGTGGGLGEYANSKLQEVAFYNYALSSTQISAHYTAGTI